MKKKDKITISLANQISLASQKNSNMKKIFILLLMVFSTTIVFSQTLDEINEMMGKKDYTGAKTAIDKYLSDAKNSSKADGWYYKGRIYNSLSDEKTTAESSLYDLKNSAFEAFKKNQQLDANDIRLKLENYASYLDIYYGLYDLGANLFNNKNYSMAFSSFKKALEVEDYILTKKYSYAQATLHPLDTALVLNTAIAATQSKNDDEAIPYYKKLADANVSGEGYRDVYELLVEYYNKKADATSLAEIMAKGKKYYPADNYWNEIEIANIAKSGDQAGVFAKYDEMLAKDPGNFLVAYNYAIELYRKINAKDAKEADNATKDKLTSVLKIAIASDTGVDATVLMANHMYNMASDALNAASLIKGTKPEDVKKKNDFKALSNKEMDECINYSELVVKYFEPKANLKPLQTANYKNVLSYLSEIYNLKGDKKKADEFDKKRATIK